MAKSCNTAKTQGKPARGAFFGATDRIRMHKIECTPIIALIGLRR
jgi:hypothetical protein